MTATERRAAIAQAYLAEAAWQHELERHFGRNACNARYLPEGEGKPGTLLAALYAFYVEARAGFHAAMCTAREA